MAICLETAIVTAPTSMQSSSPLVIGGTGGSGTRVFARVAACAGVDMGTNLNESLDAMSFERFWDLWINRYLARSSAPLSAHERAAMSLQLDECVEEHRSAKPTADRWGLKNGRSMFLLPFLNEKFPEMKFIHVILDGRDMAFSSNQNQPRLHGHAFLGDLQSRLSLPEAAMLVWSSANLQVADYGETMGKRYLRIQFEKLCLQPEASLLEIFTFLGASDQDPGPAAAEIVPPISLGRWEHQEESILQSTIDYGKAALRRFGYIP